MPPISKDCSNTFLEHSFIYSAPCEWNKLSECIRAYNFDSFRKTVNNAVNEANKKQFDVIFAYHGCAGIVV